MYIRWGGGGGGGYGKNTWSRKGATGNFPASVLGVKTKLSMKARKTTSPPPLLIKNERSLNSEAYLLCAMANSIIGLKH